MERQKDVPASRRGDSVKLVNLKTGRSASCVAVLRSYRHCTVPSSPFTPRSQGPTVCSQTDGPHRDWQASWVTHPTAPLREPLVLHFRRALTLAAVPASYPVRVSADNRFVLYVNGHRVGDGPARGDLAHWRYERFDLAPLLQAGKNLITATVWNWGIFAPVAQMSDRTAFLLESEAAGADAISTPKGWQVEIRTGPSGAGSQLRPFEDVHGRRPRRGDRCRALRLELAFGV